MKQEFYRMNGSDEASIERRLLRAGVQLGEADHQLLDNQVIRKAFAQATAESLRQATGAAIKDGIVYSKPWRFQVEAITFEYLFPWQGEQGPIMPASAAHRWRRHCHTVLSHPILLRAIFPCLSIMPGSSGKRSVLRPRPNHEQ